MILIISLTSSPCEAQKNTMFSGEILGMQSSLWYGNFRLIMQADCNLVLFDRGREVWSTNTEGKGSFCHLKMQSDANLVIYNYNDKPIWSTKTSRRNGNYMLVLQKDRNVVIYGTAFWSTKTYVSVTGITGADDDHVEPEEAGVVANVTEIVVATGGH
ncbi:Mannose-specific lectin [Acorus gramineus]|uniref:Mannose-specific lectin n=1 Tax=Acorus gramineus TaxID=55184 RepID=A0AAV9AKZ4_ACOGR|nr:Mannose-specific lectin [Acorus gramineus]